MSFNSSPNSNFKFTFPIFVFLTSNTRPLSFWGCRLLGERADCFSSGGGILTGDNFQHPFIMVQGMLNGDCRFAGCFRIGNAISTGDVGEYEIFPLFYVFLFFRFAFSFQRELSRSGYSGAIHDDLQRPRLYPKKRFVFRSLVPFFHCKGQ